MVHSRDADFKDVVLDQLLSQHDDAQLNAQLDEAASRRTLRGVRHTHLICTTLAQKKKKEKSHNHKFGCISNGKPLPSDSR